MDQKNGILSLLVDDLSVLHSAYMPFIKNGGVFVASHLNYPIGGELFLIIKFSEELEAVAVLGKVVWKNPKGFRYCGFGVQFSDRGSVTKNKIENLLAGRFDETLPSQTI